MHRPVKVAHSSHIEESHMTKHTASGLTMENRLVQKCAVVKNTLAYLSIV